MKKTVKIMAFVLCAVMLVVGSVFGTYAYLTSTTEEVKNTFTVGNVKITLDESKVTEYGVLDGTARVTENTYKLVPNKAYIKNPVIHVTADSEPCYVFVRITNNIDDVIVDDCIEAQLRAHNWILVDGETEVYMKESAISGGGDVEVFESFTTKADVNNATLATYEGKTIVVVGYAVQKEGFDSAQAAWDATFGNN